MVSLKKVAQIRRRTRGTEAIGCSASQSKNAEEDGSRLLLKDGSGRRCNRESSLRSDHASELKLPAKLVAAATAV